MATLHPTLQKVSSTSEVAFRELIKTHLARLIEIDSGFDFEQIHRSESIRSDTIFGAALTQEGICSINQLIVHISKKDNVVQKGIFRLNGSLSRQGELQKLICTGQTIFIDPNRFSVHDCCNLLKRFISELPQPLLTEALKKFFLKTLDLENREKQIDAIRLLILLLPIPNRYFLYDLLILFDTVVQHSDENLMTVDSLSTIVAHHFFRNKVNGDLITYKKEDIEAFVKCFSFMITNAQIIFEPPQQLLTDAALYLANREKIQNFSHELISSTNLAAIPAAKFCATNSSYSTKDYTEMQLAELYAQVQSMAAQSPAIKKKFLKKFNQNKNGCVTPMLQRDKQQQELIKQSLKKSQKKSENHFKILGTAIKNKFLMTPNSEKKSNRKTTTPKTISNRNSPKSIVPIEETKTITQEYSTSDNSNSTNKNSPKKPIESKIPVAIISPMKKSNENLTVLKESKIKLNSSPQKILPRTPTPRLNIKSKSNSIISSTRIPKVNLSYRRLGIIEESTKENINIQIPTSKSLSTNFYQDNTPSNEMIRRKRVKYLASKYEELIASEKSKFPNKVKWKQSSIKNKNQTIFQDNNDDCEDYVSLTSIYTKEPLEQSMKNKVAIKRCDQGSGYRQGQFRSVSMRVQSKRRNEEKHTVF